ncbi:MAG: RNA methyltransferase [Oscillospiraceae bacterium]|nr:RNA methyltransferase [Oscillospiraceae bacterium]
MEKITSRQNSTVKKLRALAKDKSYRAECGEFVCDGTKLLAEALRESFEITSVLVSEDAQGSLPDLGGVNVFIAPEDVLDSITSLKSSQNVIFSCKMKETPRENIRKAILLDRLQDTGNIGTIIRTADAFGIDAVFCDGCADIYNPKTIRSAMGSIFRVPVINEDFFSLIPSLRKNGKKVWCSELYGDVKTISECDLKDAFVVIGNEGNGVRPEISAICDGSVIIPMAGGAESLNAAIAAAVFMYEMS